MNYIDLKGRFATPAYVGLGSAAAVAQINAPVNDLTHRRWRELPKSDIENYLFNTGLRDRLDDFVSRLDILSTQNKIDLLHPDNEGTYKLYKAAKKVNSLFTGSIPSINPQNSELAAAIAGFVDGHIFLQEEADAFFAQFLYFLSDAELWFGEGTVITEQDYNISQSQDAIAFLQELREKARTASGEVEALLLAAQRARQEGQLVDVPTRDDAIARFKETMEAS